MKTITIDFVRHGQTIFNTMDKLQGWADSPLTTAGIATADQVGQLLRDTQYQSYHSSDLKRAIDTAKHIIQPNRFLQTAPEQHEAFREVFFGSYEGLDFHQAWKEVGAAQQLGCQTQAEIIQKYSFEVARDAMHAADPRHLSEDGVTFSQRVDRGIQDLLTEAQDGDRLLVVTHGTLIRSLVLRYGPDFDALANYPANGGITTLVAQAADQSGFTGKITAYNRMN